MKMENLKELRFSTTKNLLLPLSWGNEEKGMEKLFNLNCSIEKNPKFELIMSLEEELRW